MCDACLLEGLSNSPESPVDGGRLGEPELAMSAFEAPQRIRSKKLPAPACQPSTSRGTLRCSSSASASNMPSSSWYISMKPRPRGRAGEEGDVMEKVLARKQVDVMEKVCAVEKSGVMEKVRAGEEDDVTERVVLEQASKQLLVRG